MDPYIRKYAPTSSSEIVGQKKCIAQLKEFLTNYKSLKKKAVLLHGRPGCGKTSSVYALAKEMDLEVIELNASDLRNKDSIGSVLGAASQQMSLFMRSKVILVDEVDGIAGRADYGGLAEITKLIEKTSFPMILTANNPYDNKFSKLRRKVEMIGFNELSADDMVEVLRRVCLGEGIDCDDTLLKTIARRNGDDLRGAMNDLQILSTSGITKENLDEISGRDKTESMLQALMKVFKSTDTSVAVSAFENVKEDIKEQMLWLDENIPSEYKKPADLFRAYDCLSKADVFLGRIMRWQHWRFMVYAGNLMSAGVAAAKDSKSPGFVQYKPTGRILKLWWAKQKSMKKKAIAEKIAVVTHNSSKRVVQDMEYYKLMFKDKEMAAKLSDELELDKDEIAWLNK